MMDDDLMDALFHAVEPQNCSYRKCLATPVAIRDGDPVCARHRDLHDHGFHGAPCGECGSREWVATPDAAFVAVCAHCDYVTYDESKFQHSW